MKLIKNILLWLNRRWRMAAARKYGVPFREIEWYNYMCMVPKEDRKVRSFIEIFDENGKYIKHPPVGGYVVYNNKGERFLYRIVGFDNWNRNGDWLYEDDWVNPIIEYVIKINNNKNK